MNAVRAKISESGRLTIPAEIRNAIGLERGGDLVVTLQGNEIRIRSVRDIVARAQAVSRRLLGGRTDIPVGDFLAKRHQDTGGE